MNYKNNRPIMNRKQNWKDQSQIRLKIMNKIDMTITPLLWKAIWVGIVSLKTVLVQSQWD